jgi:Amt family ammonium transporter
MGAAAAIVSNLMIQWRSKTSIDDTLDVFPSHGVGGMVGMLLTGVFASKAVNPAIPEQGLYFGEWKLFTAEAIALVAVAVFVFVGTWLLLQITDAITPMRVTEEDEALGLDVSQHNERL